jgi:hypothetical protein
MNRTPVLIDRSESPPTLVVLAALLLALTSACGQVDVGTNGGDDVAVVSSALSAQDRDFVDASGQVHIKVRVCGATPSAVGLRCAYCKLDPDYVLVGGGAEIGGSPTSAQLRASFPYPSASAPAGCVGNGTAAREGLTWLARSSGTSSHTLAAVAVGLKVDGITADELIAGNYIRTHETTSTRSAQPTKDTPPFGPEYIVISGGAELLADIGVEPNAYLTELSPLEPPDQNLGWHGRGVFAGGDGFIKVFSIGLNPCLPVSTTCLQWKWRKAVAGTSGGYRSVSHATPYPWVAAGVGATGVTAGTSSRYLADLLPIQESLGQGFTVRTKDAGSTPIAGNTTGYQINLMQEGIWSFNSIRLNTAGTSFSRPTGTAPVDLQQANVYPDAAPYRWYLEPMPGGRYRVRAGNPGQGTECACRIAGNTNVRIAACGTSNDFLWTADGDTPGTGTFKLRNVANSRCIDANGQGATTSTLVFRSCVSGYSDNQSLFLDRYSWPP